MRRLLKELKIEAPYGPAIPLPVIYPKEMKSLSGREICTFLFFATLLTITKTWKQPKRPSTDEWIKKFLYMYTMEYYSAMKRNEFEAVKMRWMNLELVIQSEVSQKEKNKYHMLVHMYGI